MVACVVLAHMLDATQLHIHVACYATVCARTVRIMHGWCGGWAWLHALSWHTCWMLRNCTYMFHATQLLLVVVACVVLTHMLDAAQLHINVLFATQLYMLIVVACVLLTHMLDVTQLHIHVGCYATAHTCCMLRNCMCSYCSYHARMGCMIDRHSSARQSLVAFEKKCAKKPVQ